MTPDANAQTDLLVFDNEYVRASSMKRFINYLVDLIVFYIVFLVLFVPLFLASPETVESFADDSSLSFSLLDRLFTIVSYAVIMAVFEGLLKGKTPGKFLTGTRAVNPDGSRISWGTAFGRGFSRAVPFAALSALGTICNPWQDRWTNTMVIDEKRSSIQAS